MAYNITNAGPITMTAGEDLAAYRRVKYSSDEAVYADAGEAHDGITLEAADDGDLVAVQPVIWPGLVKVTAAGTFSAGATLYGADDGKVDDTAVGNKIGTAWEAATAAGDIITMMPSGTIAATDLQSAIAGKVHFVEDFFSGSLEDGNKFSETADQADWLVTVTDGNPDEGEVVNVDDDAPGGWVEITTNDTPGDGQELQLNGSSFELAIGRPLRFACKIAVDDVDKADVFVGLSEVDTDVLDGVNDRVGFQVDHDGNIDALVEQDTIESTTDTGADIDDCAAVANLDDEAVVLEFVWDGVDTVRFYVDGVLTNTMTDNGSTIVIPDDVVMTPTICVKTSAAQTVTAWVDFVEIIADRT